MVSTRRRTVPWARVVGVGIAVVVLVAVGAVLVDHLTGGLPHRQECRAASTDTTYVFDLEQAQNASTIAAVGKLEGMPNHAVTVALAAALQESNLRNLGYGDRDSVGLFQQRPSQGWGAREQLLVPVYAAAAFYRELERVSGWETIPVNDAAQKVQRSGTPSAYAKWEDRARALAIGLTGEQPAGLTCRVDLARTSTPPPSFLPALQRELGLSSLDVDLPPARAWTVATWLVAHAKEYRIASVSLLGQEWTAKSGRWRPSDDAGSRIHVVQE